MLAPRFTLRAGLIALTIGAFVAIAVREATLGTPWGVGVVVALASVVLSFALQALAFVFSLVLTRGRGRGGG